MLYFSQGFFAHFFFKFCRTQVPSVSLNIVITETGAFRGMCLLCLMDCLPIRHAQPFILSMSLIHKSFTQLRVVFSNHFIICLGFSFVQYSKTVVNNYTCPCLDEIYRTKIIGNHKSMRGNLKESQTSWKTTKMCLFIQRDWTVFFLKKYISNMSSYFYPIQDLENGKVMEAPYSHAQ